MEEIKTLIVEDLKGDDILRGVKSWIVVHNKSGGYTEEEFEIELKKDGTFCLRDGDNWIYMTQQKFEVLRNFMENLGLIIK